MWTCANSPTTLRTTETSYTRTRRSDSATLPMAVPSECAGQSSTRRSISLPRLHRLARPGHSARVLRSTAMVGAKFRRLAARDSTVAPVNVLRGGLDRVVPGDQGGDRRGDGDSGD
jgi:hypothetical protein